jgi:undecaprenyl-diphosphatase
MDLGQAIALALLQGLTEFLPISSSGHLILMPAFLDWADQGLGFDIAVHLGSLVAVIVYFRRDLLRMARSLARPDDEDGRLAWQIMIATVPLGLTGLLVADFVAANLRSPAVIGSTTLGFGVLLWATDRFRRGERNERSLRWSDVLAIGCGQALSLVPGTSRSGITMTVALALGMNRRSAGRFSFLLAVPAVSMVALWQFLQYLEEPGSVPWGLLGLATLVSAVTAFFAIALFLRLIERVGMFWFALYRLVLGIVIFYALV